MSEDSQQLLDMQKKRKTGLMIKEKKQWLETDPEKAVMSDLEKASARICKFLTLS